MIGRTRAPTASAAISERALRVRGVVLRHAAARFGLPEPSDADIAALPSNMTLADALARWQPAGESAVVPQHAPSRPPLLLRIAWIMTVALLALGLTYTPVG